MYVYRKSFNIFILRSKTSKLFFSQQTFTLQSQNSIPGSRGPGNRGQNPANPRDPRGEKGPKRKKDGEILAETIAEKAQLRAGGRGPLTSAPGNPNDPNSPSETPGGEADVNGFFTRQKSQPKGRSDRVDWRKPRATGEKPLHPWRRPGGSVTEDPLDKVTRSMDNRSMKNSLGAPGSNKGVIGGAIGSKPTASRRLSADTDLSKNWSELSSDKPARAGRGNRNQMPEWMDDGDSALDPSQGFGMPEFLNPGKPEKTNDRKMNGNLANNLAPAYEKAKLPDAKTNNNSQNLMTTSLTNQNNPDLSSSTSPQKTSNEDLRISSY